MCREFIQLSMEVAHIRELHSFLGRLHLFARYLPMAIGHGPIKQANGGMEMDKMMERPHAEDVELATRVSSAGDMSSFEVLYKRYFKKVYLICLKMTANPADAEDL